MRRILLADAEKRRVFAVGRCLPAFARFLNNNNEIRIKMMKINKLAAATLVAAAMVTGSCHSDMKNGEGLETDTVVYADSGEFANVKVNVVLPVANDSASARMRRQLLRLVISEINTEYEEEIKLKFSGDPDDTKSMLTYFASAKFKRWSEDARKMYEENMEYVEKDETLSEEQKAEARSNFMPFEYSLNMTKDVETKNYVVFDCYEFSYLGGAHGGVYGDGPIIFSKKDGSRLEEVISKSNTNAMQGLLREGVESYFADYGEDVDDRNIFDCLILVDSIIPLPVHLPYLDGDSMIFEYQQYEIAPYAAGMPSFKVHVNEVKPFLTPEARKVFGIE